MRIVIFSDPHIGIYNQFNTTPNSRIEDTLEVIRKMFFYASREDNLILCCGDIVDKADSMTSFVVNSLYGVFNECFLDYPQVQFVSIAGNHDIVERYNEARKSSVLDFLEKAFTNFRQVTPKEPFYLYDVQVLGIPFMDKRELFVAELEKVKKDLTKFRFNILLTHQSDPSTPFADIFIKDVEDFDFAFNGHIHQYKQHSARFFTVGSPLHRNLSDEGQDKGYLILDTEKHQVTRHLLDFPKFSAPKLESKKTSSYLVNVERKSNNELFDEYCANQKLSSETIKIGKGLL